MSLPTTPAQMKFTLQQSQDKQVMNLEQLRKYLVALEARVKVLEAKP